MLNYFKLMAVAVVTLSLTGCGATTYLVTSGSENLQSLTKITEDTKSTVSSVGGSYTDPTLFLSINEGGKHNIYKKENPLSAAMVQMTSGNNFNLSPTYCPATDRMAFCYATRTNQYNRSYYDIYMVDVTKGAGLIPVTQTTTVNEWSPSLSPDGSLIVYQSNNGSSGEIWVKNLNTGETMLLGKGFGPKISPDGKKIVFCRYKTNEYGPSSIWVMDVDGTNVMQLTANNDEKAWCPAWSPDGSRIVFSSEAKGKKKDRDLFVMNADGSGLIQLTTNNSFDDGPFWSTDGCIYFISDRGAKPNENQLWRFNIQK